MEVAVPEEPQKKIFRARKTMKMSDRQQLETLHNTLSSAASNSSSSPSPSSRPQTPLVNGTHVEDCQKAKEKEKDLQQPPSSSPSHSRSPSPSGKKGSEKGNVDETKTEKKDDKKLEGSEVDKMETSKSDKKEDPKKAPVDQLINGEIPAVDIERAPIDNGSAEEKGTKSTSSSASGSPAADLECDPEVKEGFLFLSEEDEGQGDKDEAKEKSEAKMDVDAVKDEKKDDVKAADGTGISTPAGKKRSFSSEGAKDGQKDVEVKDERAGKKARVEGVELEAQLELKITADAGSRLKLEKVVQQLVEDRLRVLQLTVFDHNLKELKERVEKIDSATKQQSALQHISSLQTKISRLAKKFGAANQASENSRKAQEAAAAAAKASATNTSTITQRGYERTTLDPKLSNTSLGSASSSATPTQPKPLSTPTTASSALAAPAPILQILSTATGSTPSSSASLTGQAQTGTLLLQTRPTTGVMTTNTTAAGGQSMSIQPLLIQLPLAMANGQAGPLAGGVGLIPVSSLGTVNNLNKAKTTTATTTIILQKSAGNVVSSSSPSSSSTAPQMSSGRSLYQGGSSNVNSPNAAVSATARTPTQCAAVLGVVRGSSSPATTGPAATGSAAAATGPPSASAMASKTDNQASSSTPAKSPSQSARPKSSFIDLTEDDDDVQVTGVQKATAPSVAPSAPRPSAAPPLVTSSSAAGRTTVQHRPSVDSPSKSRPGSSSSASLPPLPLAPAPPARLPPEATHTSPPQQPQLKLARVQSQNGIVLSWCVAETDRSCAAVDSYHLYAYHQDHQGSTSSSSSQLWKKIGEVKALPLPMACTLTQFVSGSTYYFAVRAKDVYGRFGPFCEPQCTDVINPPSTSSS